MVRTQASQAWNRGSIPLRAAKKKDQHSLVFFLDDSLWRFEPQEFDLSFRSEIYIAKRNNNLFRNEIERRRIPLQATTNHSH